MVKPMENRIHLLTGGTSGIGKEIAIACAKQGDTVILLARNVPKAEAMIQEFTQSHPNAKGSFNVVNADFSDLQSVKTACEEVRSKYTTIDIINNNAGIMNFDYQESKDGIEETLQVNVLAPLLITHLLLDLVSKNGKILFTASALHQGDINFENLEFKDSFSAFKVYRQSKLGIILLTRYLAKEYANQQVGFYAIHPGVVNTQLGRSAGWFSRLFFKLMGTTPQKGAETHLFVLGKENHELVSGEYYAKSKVTKITPQSYNMKTARALLLRCKEYLQPYIDSKKSFFETE
jgi:NAD(P)-dependent dehydrogenase (short-subunit alcohol dehydrogenase family)